MSPIVLSEARILPSRPIAGLLASQRDALAIDRVPLLAHRQGLEDARVGAALWNAARDAADHLLAEGDVTLL